MVRSAVFALFLVTTSPVLAQQNGAGFDEGARVMVTGVALGSVLNLRQGPGTTHPVLGTLAAEQRGLTVQYCDSTGRWCRVRGASGQDGWVASAYLGAEMATEAEAPAPNRPDIAATPAPMPSAPPEPTPPLSPEADRLTRITGLSLDPSGTTSIPELPPYLRGAWDRDQSACAAPNSESRVTILKNGLTVAGVTARFKNALFRGDGYDLTTLLMREPDLPNAAPLRALYRVQPDGVGVLVLTGDRIGEQRLVLCPR